MHAGEREMKIQYGLEYEKEREGERSDCDSDIMSEERTENLP